MKYHGKFYQTIKKTRQPERFAGLLPISTIIRVIIKLTSATFMRGMNIHYTVGIHMEMVGMVDG